MRKLPVVFLFLCCIHTGRLTAQQTELWGTMPNSGAVQNARGDIFKMKLDGSGFIVPYTFVSDGATPSGTVCKASNGKLYGMTTYGGAWGGGSIYSFDPLANVYTTLYNFYIYGSSGGYDPNGPGYYPQGNSLMQASDGKLYGMVTQGGASDNGTVISFDPATNTYTKVHDFNFADGARPFGSLMQASDGKLYGMTSDGGAGGHLGVIFSIDPAVPNSYSVVYNWVGSFGPQGGQPYGGLVQALDGKLYGMAHYGGNGSGVIFSFNPATNTYNMEFALDYYLNGSSPLGNLIQASNGLLYGVASQGGEIDDGFGNREGTLFSFNPVSKSFTKLYDFHGIDGGLPKGNLFEASNGKLYGMTSSGGAGVFNAGGVIFSFDPSTHTYTNMRNLSPGDGINPSVGSGFISLPAPDALVMTATPSSPVCAGNSISLSYTATGTFGAGNIFTAQLSDGSGSFSSPVNIGTLSSVVSGTINVTIPSNTAYSTGYRIRINSSAPAEIGSDNGTDISIGIHATASANSPVCAGNTLNLSVVSSSGNSSLYSWVGPGGFTSQLQNPVITHAGTTNSGTYTVTVTSGCASTTASSIVIVNPQPTWYADADGDGYGNFAVSQVSCTQPAGYVLDNSDCNDANPAVHPGATEVCNGIDDDCDGLIDENLMSGTVLYLPFNGSANDASGNMHNGTAFNVSATADHSGYANSAYSFNGSNARIEIADHADLKPANLTISLWTRYASVPSNIQGLVNKPICPGNFDSYGLYFVGGLLRAGWSDGNSQSEIVVNPPSVNQWHFLALTFDDVNNMAKLYVDGSLTGSAASSASLVYTSTPFQVGADIESCSANYFFNGSIDEVMLQNRALSASEIATLYQNSGNLILQQSPAVSISASPSATVCANGTINFNASAVNAGASPSYQWKKNNIDVGTNSASYAATGLLNGDVIKCILTSDASCLSSVATSGNIVVTVNQPASSSTTVALCQQQFPYTWNGTSYTGPGTYVTHFTTASGCDSAATLVLLLKTLGDTVAGPKNACAYTGSLGLNATYSIAAIGATHYAWSVPTGAVLLSGQGTGTITVHYNSTFHGGPINVSVSNECSSSFASLSANAVAITGTPVTSSPPGGRPPIDGHHKVPICGAIGLAPGQHCQVLYSVPSSSRSAADSNLVEGGLFYHWTLPALARMVSATPDSSNIEVEFDSLYTSGSLTVKLVSGCGSSPAQTFAVAALIPATPGPITGPTNACLFRITDSAVYTIRKVADATRYNWTVPSGAAIVSHPGGAGSENDTSIVVSFNPDLIDNTRITVRSQTGIKLSPATSSLAIRRIIPLTPAAISGPADVCNFIQVAESMPAAGAVFSIRKTANANAYVWKVPAGAIVTHPGTGANDTLITVIFGNGFTKDTVSVSAQNSCGISAVRTKIVSRVLPAIPGTITGPADACPYIFGGTDATYSIRKVLGTTPAAFYDWGLTDSVHAHIISHPGGSGTVNDTAITVHFETGFISGAVTVMSARTCGASNVKLLIVTKKVPALPTITGNPLPCPNTTETYTANSATGSFYTWTVPASIGTFTGQNSSTIQVHFKSTFNSGAISVKAISVCGTSGTRSATLAKCTGGFAATTVSSSAKKGSVNPPVVTKQKTPDIDMAKKGYVEQDLRVYPNPTDGDFTIINSMKGPGKMLINIINTKGQTMFRKEEDNSSGIIKLSLKNKLLPGIYLVSCSTNERTITKMFVVNK